MYTKAAILVVMGNRLWLTHQSPVGFCCLTKPGNAAISLAQKLGHLRIKYNWYPSLKLNRNINSPSIAHFRFSNAFSKKPEIQEIKWQCSQNLDLNLTSGKRESIEFIEDTTIIIIVRQWQN